MYELLALTQANWEDTFSKKEIRNRIAKLLMNKDNIQALIDEAVGALYCYYSDESIFWYESKQTNWDALFSNNVIKSLVQDMFVLITMNGYVNIQAIVGQLTEHTKEHLPLIPAIKTMSEILVQIAKDSDLWTVYEPAATDEGVIMVEAIYEFDEEVKQYIANTKYLPPMLIRPKMINNNFDYDYLNKPSSKILGSQNHHDDPIALDVLNIMNGIPLKLDTFMLQYDEMPNKELDTVEKVEQFNRMAKASREVYEQILSVGNRFFQTHKYDKRGRLYSQGYHVHIQSTDYKKSLISLHKGELLNNF